MNCQEGQWDPTRLSGHPYGNERKLSLIGLPGTLVGASFSRILRPHWNVREHSSATLQGILTSRHDIRQMWQ